MPAATSTVKFHPVRSTCGGLKFSGGEDIFAGFQPPFPTKEAKERERKDWAVATASHPLSLSSLPVSVLVRAIVRAIFQLRGWSVGGWARGLAEVVSWL